MRKPFKNRMIFGKIKTDLNSFYPEYKQLMITKHDPHRLDYLITLISSLEQNQ